MSGGSKPQRERSHTVESGTQNQSTWGAFGYDPMVQGAVNNAVGRVNAMGAQTTSPTQFADMFEAQTLGAQNAIDNQFANQVNDINAGMGLGRGGSASVLAQLEAGRLAGESKAGLIADARTRGFQYGHDYGLNKEQTLANILATLPKNTFTTGGMEGETYGEQTRNTQTNMAQPGYLQTGIGILSMLGGQAIKGATMGAFGGAGA